MEKSVTDTTLPVMGQRFRGFLPVVVDVETAGFNAKPMPCWKLLPFQLFMMRMANLYQVKRIMRISTRFEGANLDRRSLDFIGIDPFNPMRMAMAEDEKTALKRIFKSVNEVRRQQNCTHAILVGHNAHFDLGFVQAAIARTGTKNQNPFHSFSVFDTVTLSAVMFGQTVLAKSCIQAGIEFDGKEATFSFIRYAKNCRAVLFYSE